MTLDNAVKQCHKEILGEGGGGNFPEGHFSGGGWGVGGIFLGVYFRGQFSGGFFPRGIFQDINCDFTLWVYLERKRISSESKHSLSETETCLLKDYHRDIKNINKNHYVKNL